MSKALLCSLDSFATADASRVVSEELFSHGRCCEPRHGGVEAASPGKSILFPLSNTSHPVYKLMFFFISFLLIFFSPNMGTDAGRLVDFRTVTADSSDAWYLNNSTREPPLTTTQPSLTAQTPSRRRSYYWTPNSTASYWHIQDAPVPNITVFRQMQDREHVMVMCSFGRRFIESSFQLSVEGEHSYILKNPLLSSNEKCVFDVNVSSSVSFTCVHKINYVVNQQSETYTYSPSAQPSNMSTPYFKTQKAQNPITSTPCYKTQKTQNPITCTPCFKTQKAQNPITCTPCYKTPIFLQHEEGVSSFYIGFFSFIVVGLVIMTAAVIMTTLKSNTKGSVITETENDYTNV